MTPPGHVCTLQQVLDNAELIQGTAQPHRMHKKTVSCFVHSISIAGGPGHEHDSSIGVLATLHVNVLDLTPHAQPPSPMRGARTFRDNENNCEPQSVDVYV